jgi:two-component system, chemotaxis family, response regulator PixG
MLTAQDRITSSSNHLQDFLRQLQRVKNHFFTGSLIVHLHNNSSCLVFNFYLGRLSWSGRSFGQLDSWRQHLGAISTQISGVEINALAAVYQPELVSATLISLLAKQKINRRQLQEVIASIFEENLFDAIQFACVGNAPFHYEWILSSEKVKTLAPTLPLLSIKSHVKSAFEKWLLWQGRGFANVYPNLPIQIIDLVQTDELTLTERQQKLLPFLLEGTNLRTLANSLRQPTHSLAETLLPLIKNEVVNLVPPTSIETEISSNLAKSLDASDFLEDHNFTSLFPPTVLAIDNPEAQKSLIFCIDDSEAVYHSLCNILIPHGYQVMGIQDSTRAIPALIKAKPDLIFLDLIMPIANGYEICTQIRRTPSLAKVPVIILTGKDGLIDKFRAKMVGSNDFITKPIDSEAVLKTLFFYLPVK